MASSKELNEILYKNKHLYILGISWQSLGLPPAKHRLCLKDKSRLPLKGNGYKQGTACNPSNLGGWGGRITNSGPDLAT